ncbi:DUF5615 family PIN-like protein [Terricaulis silvestris]|uniref:DUF5615 domain-containing protein n=1 Tax=Terricaulis silvestris TaxID=2686094 RepID=A0A6I6MLZ7_9CAUL|nr:DUF5615 family PIN-like protein [Terricaulis silvestris]QGZ95699.1 hypothetical protein DSM104635_02550 [Terricaulis silvestris]
MRVILDECLPRVLGDDLTGHDVQTVQQAGFDGLKNGELLKRIAAAQFDAFVTVDKNLPTEQRAASLSFGIVVLRAKSNRIQDLRPLANKIVDALTTLKPGRVAIVAKGRR